MDDMKGVNDSTLTQIKFYNDNKDLGYYTVSKYIKNQYDVEDVVQNSFIKIFNILEKIEVHKNFKGFLYKVFKNTALDFLRKKKYSYEYLDEIYSESIIDDNECKEEMLSDIESEISNLSPMYHLVFKCYHIEQMTHKDISLKLGISEGTSKSNLHKATKNIQKKLKNKVYE
jgi:RNA polymerase sigma factor (sigma-70 family)